MPRETPKRCALYARFSPKPEGAVGENYSIGSQLDAMRELALCEYGCAQPDEYIDRNVSGATLDRPDLERLRDAVASRAYDVVLCYSPDRLSRDVVNSMVLLQEFSKYGVKLAFVSGSYDDSPEGEFSFGVQSLVAQFERKKFAERSRRGRRRKAAEGFVHSGSAPYGYRYLGHKFKKRGELEIIPAEARVVEQVFQWTARGMTNYRVAMQLNAQGILTQKGGRWYRESIAQVLRKTAYYGEVPGPAGIIIPVPAIVTRALWDRAHDTLQRNRAGKVGRPSRQYLLTGMLWCARCGARCTTFPERKMDATYRCNGVDRHTRKRICQASGIRKSKLEPAVEKAVWDTITDQVLLWKMITAYHARTATKPGAGRKDPAVERIDRARRRVERAEAIFRDPDQPIPYARAKADVEAARRELLEAETARPAEVVMLPERASIAAIAREFASARDEVKDFADRRGIIERVVEKIRYADREVEITCKISMEPKNCNRHVRAYAQGQCEHGNGGEPRAAAEHHQAEADILPKGFHRRKGHFMSHLLQQDGMAEWAARR
jgi:site-specific DNA recombinase